MTGPLFEGKTDFLGKVQQGIDFLRGFEKLSLDQNKRNSYFGYYNYSDEAGYQKGGFNPAAKASICLPIFVETGERVECVELRTKFK